MPSTSSMPPVAMPRTRKWLVGLGIGAGVLALAAAVLVSLVPSEEALARRAASELETVLGVPVSIGALHWQLLPSPQVVIENLATRQPQQIELKKLTAHFNASALWHLRLKVDRAELQGAVLPQLSLRALKAKAPALDPDARLKFSVDEVPLDSITFEQVTWISRNGNRTVYAGDAQFDPGWRPRTAQLRLAEASAGTDLALTRQGQEDRWEARINIGGGTVHGELQLQASPLGKDGGQGGLRLSGRLQPRNVEVSSALQAFHRRSIVAGKASGSTTLQASGATLAELAQSLHTSTAFTMGRSTLLRFDLDKAIRTIGKQHDGKTPLDAISGQIDTQNTPQGIVVNFSQIKTSSGVLSASGQARVANRQIEAEFAVDLVDGLIGVPLKISGPVSKVQVSVPASALVGAAIGTAVLPGIGTAIGARLGTALEGLFGGGAKPAGRKSLAPLEKSR